MFQMSISFFYLNFGQIYLCKVFLLLNAAFALAILGLIPGVHLASFVITLTSS